MSRIFRKNTVLVLAMVLIMSLMLTSCGLLGGGSKAAEEIEGSVDKYFRSISSGRLARDEYESDFAEDAPFADLVFAEAVAETLMVDGMATISYEIEEVEADSRKKEGVCDVLVTAIDVDKIINELGDAYSEDDFVALFEAEDAPTKEHEISLELYYDEDEETWVIEDTSEVAEILGIPYTKIEFSAAGPQGVADAFLSALSNSDFNKVSELSNSYYIESDFIDITLPISSELFATAFGNMQAELVDEYLTDSYAEYTYSIVVPDYDEVLLLMSEDSAFLIGATEIVFYTSLTAASDTDFEGALGAYLEAVGRKAIEMMQSSGLTKDMQVVISLSYSELSEAWYVSSCSYDLFIFSDVYYNYDPMDYLYESDFSDVAEAALNNLFSSGRISQEQYNMGLSHFTNVVVEVDYEVDYVLSMIDASAWWDWSLNQYVDFYTAPVSKLNIDLDFFATMPGLTLYCDFFADGGDTVIDTVEVTMSSSLYYAEFILEGTFESGMYKAVIYMEDGTILEESDIEIR